MIVFVNGEFVPEERATVSVFDRGFLYGDGLFETLKVANGQPFRWEQHATRLQCGADFLKISVPYPEACLRDFASQLILRNELTNGLLRVTVSRGVGKRGYSPQSAGNPSVVMSLHPAPAPSADLPPWRLITSSVRLPANEPLAQFKTCNKLPQIMARAEADRAGADEALLLNTNGYVAEGSSSNVFWVQNDTVCTPPLACGVLAGVTRAVVFELCEQLGIAVCEANILPQQLLQAQGVFLSLSSVGVAAAVSLDEKPLGHSSLTATIQHAYEELLRRETQGLPA